MGILDVLKSIGNGIGTLAKNAVNTVKGAISSVFNAGKETVNKILDIPKAAITTARDLGGKITQTVGGAVHDVSGGLSSFYEEEVCFFCLKQLILELYNQYYFV